MEIQSKSLFTYLDLAMDHFNITYEIREKYLIWVIDFFELSDDKIKKWSKVGKGVDYHTFKHWVAKENRFTSSKKVWPKRNFDIVSHYHSVESVLEKVSSNSYEDKLHFYHALALLALVDKKYILRRIEFLNWTAAALELDSSDCTVIREHVVEEFDLAFEVRNLQEDEKEDIFLCGIKMAFLSGDIIDTVEIDFLCNLKSRLGINVSHSNLNYFTHYLNNRLSTNESHSRLTLHKVGAILLNIIGSDDSVDKREGTWFKGQFGSLDNTLLASLLSNSTTSIIDGLSNADKMLCYLLGLDVSLRDRTLHENEKFWLNYIYESIPENFILDDDLSLVFFDVSNKNIELIADSWSFFSRVTNHLNSSSSKLCAKWNYLYELGQLDSQYKKISYLFFREPYILSLKEKVNTIIEFSFSLMTLEGDEILTEGYKSKVDEFVNLETQGLYGEMLICEILRISLLDNHIEVLEEDYLRYIQMRFNINDTQLHKVVFITAFTIGRKIELSPRLNYHFL